MVASVLVPGTTSIRKRAHLCICDNDKGITRRDRQTPSEGK